MFGTTADLMRLGETFNGTPPLGNLLFWEAAGTQHCGVAVLKNGFRVYSITQQKGLAEIPQGARTFDVRALLAEDYVPNQSNTTEYGMLYAVDKHYYPIGNGETATIGDGQIIFSSGNRIMPEHINWIPLGKLKLLKNDEIGIIYHSDVIQQIVLKRGESAFENYLIDNNAIQIHHFFKIDKDFKTAIVEMVEKIESTPNQSNPLDLSGAFDERKVEHGLLNILLYNNKKHILKLDSGLPKNGGQPEVNPYRFDESAWAQLLLIKEEKLPFPPVWSGGTIKIDSVNVPFVACYPQELYQKIIIENNPLLPLHIDETIREYFTPPNTDNNATMISPSPVDFIPDAVFSQTLDKTQILYTAGTKNIVFYATGAVQNSDGTVVVNNYDYGRSNVAGVSSALAIPYIYFKQLFAK